MKRVLSILLAVLMLIINMSVTVNTHYCGGKAVKSSVSFGHDELSCGMVKMDEKASHTCDHDQNITEQGCCENTSATLSVDDYSNLEVVSPKLAIKFVVAFVVVYINNYIFENKVSISFIAYSPPLIELDRSVLFQIFRI